jgi:hypothetical protein
MSLTRNIKFDTAYAGHLPLPAMSIAAPSADACPMWDKLPMDYRSGNETTQEARFT